MFIVTRLAAVLTVVFALVDLASAQSFHPARECARCADNGRFNPSPRAEATGTEARATRGALYAQIIAKRSLLRDSVSQRGDEHPALGRWDSRSIRGLRA